MNANTAFDSNEILRRLETLERQNRRFKRGGLAGLLIVVGLLATAQIRPPGAIKATEFQLVDTSGTMRGTLGLSGGSAELRLLDPNGAASATLSTGSDGSSLTFYALGKRRMVLRTSPFERGTPSVGIPSGLIPFPLLAVPAWMLDSNFFHPWAGQAAAAHYASSLDFYDGKGVQDVLLREDSGLASLGLSDGYATVIANAQPGAAWLKVDDGRFDTYLGNLGLVSSATGEKSETSAASIRMFGEKPARAIWVAPDQR